MPSGPYSHPTPSRNSALGGDKSTDQANRPVNPKLMEPLIELMNGFVSAMPERTWAALIELPTANRRSAMLARLSGSWTTLDLARISSR